MSNLSVFINYLIGLLQNNQIGGDHRLDELVKEYHDESEKRADKLIKDYDLTPG